MKLAFALAGALMLTAGAGWAQAPLRITPPEVTNAEWERAFPPFRVVGNLYYVGTYDLSAFLITTPEGHILINSGISSSVPMIRANIEALGFRFADIRLITATHAHWDHVAGLGEIKRLTRARMLMHEADVDMVESGGNIDYRRPQGRGTIYEPVRVDQRLKHGDTFALGGVELTAHHHPGHTKGSTSFTFTTAEGGRSYDVLIANMASVNAGTRLVNAVGYENIAEEYAMTFERQKALNPDVWVASHAGQFRLHEKYKPGDAYDPMRFSGGWQEAVARLDRAFRERLQRERQEAAR
jgi:metallo-beta-lactamase class B